MKAAYRHHERQSGGIGKRFHVGGVDAGVFPSALTCSANAPELQTKPVPVMSFSLVLLPPGLVIN